MDTWSDINEEAKQNHIELSALTETQIYKKCWTFINISRKIWSGNRYMALAERKITREKEWSIVKLAVLKRDVICFDLFRMYLQ